MEGFKDDQNKSNQKNSLAKKVTGKVKDTIYQCQKKQIYILGIFRGVINILKEIYFRDLQLKKINHGSGEDGSIGKHSTWNIPQPHQNYN